MIERDCEVCGVRFGVSPCYVRRGPKRGRCCSKPCAAKARAEASPNTVENRLRLVDPSFVFDDRYYEAKPKLQRVWRCMFERCYSTGQKDFKYYGGRGIGVCEGWRDFPAFLAWALSSGYAPGLTLDREDNDGGYSPENCRWATRTRQARNTRKNTFSETSAAEVRRLRGLGHRYFEIAAMFQTSSTQIMAICQNKIWR